MSSLVAAAPAAVSPVVPSQREVIHLLRRPIGMPVAEDFALLREPLLPGREDQVLIENLWLSVDPYMREAMTAEWPLQGALEGRSLGRVQVSSQAALPVGSLVLHRQGWCSHCWLPAAACRPLAPVAGVPPETWLSLLGGTGLTAYVALRHILRLQSGEAMLVSAAAGGVGTAVAQFARLMGAGTLVGCCGSEAKARWLMEMGVYDLVTDYHAADSHARQRAHRREGYATAVENVGGAQLERTIDLMAPDGRIAWVGAVAQYNGEVPAAPWNLYDVVERGLTLRGFLVRHYRAEQQALEAWALPHLQNGTLRPLTQVYSGLAAMVPAFIDMLHGRNRGKTLVQLSD